MKNAIQTANEYLQKTQNTAPETLNHAERAILGNNRIKAYTVLALAEILPQMEKFIGKKVFLANGAKSAKFTPVLFDVPFISNLGQTYRTYISENYNRATLFNDITILDKRFKEGGYGVNYYKKSVEIGEISKQGVLLSVPDFEKVVRDYDLLNFGDASELQKLKAKAEQLKDELRKIQHQLAAHGINT